MKTPIHSLFRLVLIFASSGLLGQTVTVTSPAAGTISGLIPLTATVSSAPSTFTVDYIVNDFYLVARVPSGDQNWTFHKWNTGLFGDGPARIKAVARDVFGAVLATSASVAVTINNFGITCTINSPTSLAHPTVAGTLTVDWTCTPSGALILNSVCMIDGYQFGWSPAGYPTGGTAFTYDTRNVPNGDHTVSCNSQLSTSFLSPAPTGVSFLPYINFSFVADVENGHTVMAVKPDVTDLVLVVGGGACSNGTYVQSGCGSYQMNTVLAYTDATTGASAGLTYTAHYACILANAARPDIPFQCVSGNTSPPTGSQGAVYTTITGSGSTVTITAALKGHTILKVLDNASGKFAYVHIAVKQYATVPHFGKDGSILTSYDATKSFIRNSLFNTPAMTGGESQLATELQKAKFTAFEYTPYRLPHNYASFAAWKSAWDANEHAQFTNDVAATGGMSVVMRADNFFTPSDMNDVIQGPSASWFPSDPWTYVLTTLKATGKLAGIESKDEHDNGWCTFNPTYDLEMSNGSIDHVVVSGGHAIWSGGINSLYAASTRFGGTVTITGATTAGLNGTFAVENLYCAGWNLWLNGHCPSNNTPPPFPYNTFSTSTGAADGTYTISTDPGLKMNAWASTGCDYTVYSGQPALPTNAYQTITARTRAVGVPLAFPNLAIGDFVTHLLWQSAQVADYETVYHTAPAPFFDGTQASAFLFGLSYFSGRETLRRLTWGCTDQADCANFAGSYDQNDANWGYVIQQQDVPKSWEVPFNSFSWVPGGRSRTISSFTNGSCMTTTAAHGIGVPGNGPVNYAAQLLISGSGDTNLNTANGGKWIAGLSCGSGGVEVLYWSRGKPGCSGTTGNGTVTIRGKTYTMAFGGGTDQIILTGGPLGNGHVPADLLPGEHVVITGDSTSCANDTYAFGGFPYPSTRQDWTYLNFPVSSTATNGTVLINDDQGYVNPLIDYITVPHRPAATQSSMLYAAGLGYSAFRNYQYTSVAILSGNWFNQWVGSGQTVQSTPSPYANAPIEFQRFWWAQAHANALLNRLTPLFLDTHQPSPNFAATPFVNCTVHWSAAYGKLLQCSNFGESSATFTVDHSKYQIGSNPVSQYRLIYPSFQTDLLTGLLTTTTYTLAAGESVVLVYHPGAASFVLPVPINFTMPSGAAKLALRYTYGSYSTPLNESIGALSCSSSPCTVNLDTRLGAVIGQFLYLDANNVLISRGDVQQILPGT